MANTVNLEILHLTEAQAQPHVSVNAGFDDLDGAIAGMLDVPVTTANVVLSDAQALRSLAFNLSGASTGARDVTVPSNRKFYLVRNGTTGGFAHTFRTSGTGVVLATNAWALLYCDGVNVAGVAVLGSSNLDDLGDVILTAVAAGQMLRRNSGNTAFVNEPVPYDVGGAANGAPTAGGTLTPYAVPRPLRLVAGATDSVGVAGTGPSAQTDFTIAKNGVSIGTMRFATSATSATFVGVSQVDFASQDVLSVVAPSSLNGLLDLRYTIALIRR